MSVLRRLGNGTVVPFLTISSFFWTLPAVPAPGASEEPSEHRAADNRRPGCTIGAELVEEEAEENPGVLVRAIQPGGPSEKAGLRPRDRIMKLDGKETADFYDLYLVLDGLHEGQAVKVEVLRPRRRKSAWRSSI